MSTCPDCDGLVDGDGVTLGDGCLYGSDSCKTCGACFCDESC